MKAIMTIFELVRVALDELYEEGLKAIWQFISYRRKNPGSIDLSLSKLQSAL